MPQSFRSLARKLSAALVTAGSVELTSLGNGNNIVVSENGRKAIGLNRSWDLIATFPDIVQHDRMEAGIFELFLEISLCARKIIRQAYLCDRQNFSLGFKGHIKIFGEPACVSDDSDSRISTPYSLKYSAFSGKVVP